MSESQGSSVELEGIEAKKNQYLNLRDLLEGYKSTLQATLDTSGGVEQFSTNFESIATWQDNLTGDAMNYYYDKVGQHCTKVKNLIEDMRAFQNILDTSINEAQSLYDKYSSEYDAKVNELAAESEE